MTSEPITYGRAAQALHWSSALLLLLLWPLGILMTGLGDGAAKTALYRAHVGIGLVVLVLTIVRLVWARSDTRPGPPPGLSRRNTWLFHATHGALLGAILLLAGSGIGMLLLSGMAPWPWAVAPEQIADVPPVALHFVLSRLFLLLFLMHVGGIVRHQMSKGASLARMGVGRG